MTFISMLFGIKGTWYEYGTIAKTFKNISACSKPIRNTDVLGKPQE